MAVPSRPSSHCRKARSGGRTGSPRGDRAIYMYFEWGDGVMGNLVSQGPIAFVKAFERVAIGVHPFFVPLQPFRVGVKSVRVTGSGQARRFLLEDVLFPFDPVTLIAQRLPFRGNFFKHGYPRRQ